MILLASWGCPRTSADPIDEDDFWGRLRVTEALLAEAITESGSRRQLTQAEIRRQWEGVDAVHVDDETIALDMRWLTAPLIFDNTENLQTLRARVQTLLAHHAREGDFVSGTSASLETLDGVLRDPRFQYADVTPTPVPPDRPPVEQRSAPIDALSPELSQLLLIAGSAAAVIVVLAFFARSFRVKPVDLPASDELSDDPTSSRAADDLALASEQARDYRAAIRYLYLSSLLMLDERGLIHYDRTLTNREHLRQIANNPLLSDVLRPVINMFERVWYGYAAVDEAMYAEFRQNVERLRQLAP
jgi:hypothetical protein